MAKVSWIDGSADWTTAADWDTGSVPGAGDDVVLGGNSIFYTVSLTTVVTVNSITLSGLGGATLAVTTPPGGNSPGTDTVTGDVSIGSQNRLNLFWNIGDPGKATQGATMIVGGSLTNSGLLEVDSIFSESQGPGGSTLSIAGTLTNSGSVAIGHRSMTLDSTVNAGGLSNTGAISLEGSIGHRSSPPQDHLAWLNIGAAAPAIWTGQFQSFGNTLLEFASGGITSIAGGATIRLGGSNVRSSGDEARVSIASDTVNNSALTGLSSIAGQLAVTELAVVSTTTDLNVTGATASLAVIDAGGMTIGGTLTNSAIVTVGNDFDGGNFGETTLTAAGLSNTGKLTISGVLGATPFNSLGEARVNITAAAPTIWTGKAQIIDNALLEFASGGITGIAAGASIFLGGAQSGTGTESRIAIASDTLSNSALTGLAGNAGDFELTGGAVVKTNAGVDFTNSGTLGVDGTFTFNGLVASTNLTIGGMLTNTSSGSAIIGDVSLTQPTVLTAAGLSNAGKLSITGGSSNATAKFTVNGSTSNSGTVTIGSFATLDDGANSYNQTAGATVVTGTLNTAAFDITGGSLELAVGGVVSGGIDFRSVAGSTLKIDGTTMPTNTISELAAGDRFDLANVAFDPNGSAVVIAGNRLHITEGAGTFDLQLDQSYAGFNFVLSADTGTGSLVTEQATCFCRGTLILTGRGEVPVEELTVGDRVKTLSGALKPIVWIGFGRDLVTRANRLARPVVVCQGALADNVPHRDLYLTHGHALFVEGVLIPVENLVNHRSIRWDDTPRVVEYYHIELADHDVVLADGAATETYYDAGNRASFQNMRRGSAAGADKPVFAPVLSGGAVVDRVWAALHRRAGGPIEHDTTDDLDLHLVVDGRRVDPAVADGAYAFALTAPTGGPLRLCSRSGVPSLLGITAHDHRRLGAAISRIVISQPGIATAIEHDAPLFLAGGCHPAEDGYCWTDGEFELPAQLFAHLSGAFILAVYTEQPGMRYPMTSVRAAAA